MYDVLESRADIEAILRRDEAVHVYEIGDLDPRFWPRTTWFASPGREAIALLYDAGDHRDLLCFEREPSDAAKSLVTDVLASIELPVYCHLSPHLMRLIDRPRGHRVGQKMVLSHRELLSDPHRVEVLTPADEAEVAAFLDHAYPKNWFDPWMLETLMYVGIRDDGDLVAAGGVHVFSPRYGVAAIGNVAVDPKSRGEGFGRQLMTSLTHRLLREVDTVALNVMVDNRAAIRCYEGIGFTRVIEYHEGWAD